MPPKTKPKKRSQKTHKLYVSCSLESYTHQLYRIVTVSSTPERTRQDKEKAAAGGSWAPRVPVDQFRMTNEAADKMFGRPMVPGESFEIMYTVRNKTRCKAKQED